MNDNPILDRGALNPGSGGARILTRSCDIFDGLDTHVHRVHHETAKGDPGKGPMFDHQMAMTTIQPAYVVSNFEGASSDDDHANYYPCHFLTSSELNDPDFAQFSEGIRHLTVSTSLTEDVQVFDKDHRSSARKRISRAESAPCDYFSLP